MSYEVEQNERPTIIQAETKFFIRFKPKAGVFSVYNRETKENKDVKTLDIVKISDSRFTVKAAQNEVGAFVFSGLYRDARNTITVLEKRDGKTGVIAEGNWQAIKQNPNLKYVRVLFCLYKDGKKWEKAQFDFVGISAIQWQKVSADGVLTLAVSGTMDFETPRGNFFSIAKTDTKEVPKDADEQAKEFAQKVKRVYDSYDESANYYAKERGMGNVVEDSPEQDKKEITKQDLVDTGLIEDEVSPESVPF